MPITCGITSSDPRLSGIQSSDFNQDCYTSDGGEVCVYWGTQGIVGPDGTWEGWFTGTVGEDGNGYRYVVLAGTGGYEGLTNIRHAIGPVPYGMEAGVVYAGQPPPIPERLAE